MCFIQNDQPIYCSDLDESDTQEREDVHVDLRNTAMLALIAGSSSLGSIFRHLPK